MTRLLPALALVCVLTGTLAAARQSAEPVEATPQNAAAFIGEWAVAANEASMTVVLKVVEEKLVTEVVAQTGTHPAGAWIAGPNLLLSYNFDYDGMAIDAEVTLAPNEPEKRVDAYLSFAAGAAQFTGTATKK